MPFYRARRHRFRPNARARAPRPRATAPIPHSTFPLPLRSVAREDSSEQLVDYKGLHIMNDLQYYREYNTLESQTFEDANTVVAFDHVVWTLPSTGNEPRLVFTAPRTGLYQFQIDVALGDTLDTLGIQLVCTTTGERIWQTTQTAFTGHNTARTMVFLEQGTRWHIALEKPEQAPHTTYTADVKCMLDKALNTSA